MCQGREREGDHPHSQFSILNFEFPSTPARIYLEGRLGIEN
jgi:hypothetical protein